MSSPRCSGRPIPSRPQRFPRGRADGRCGLFRREAPMRSAHAPGDRSRRPGLPLDCTKPRKDQETEMIKLKRIGHATFTTPDLDKAIDYYTEVNGLLLAEREKKRAFL